MKTALLLLLVSLTATAFADYKSEVAAIEKFEKDEFLNEKNYPPRVPGKVPELNKAFYDKLLAEPTSLKYFFVLSTHYKVLRKYKDDKAFALGLESKFGGKKMDQAQWEKVYEFYATNILKETNAEQKKAIASFDASKAHFEKHLALLNAASFK